MAVIRNLNGRSTPSGHAPSQNYSDNAAKAKKTAEAKAKASQICLNRLANERTEWMKDHPFGFTARPLKDCKGVTNMKTWECLIPGKENTPWSGGYYAVRLEFGDDYPMAPPKVIFSPVINHPNVYRDGNVCLSLLSYQWRPSKTIKEILVGLQELLDNPNPNSPANGGASMMFRKNKKQYDEKTREYAKLHTTPVLPSRKPAAKK